MKNKLNTLVSLLFVFTLLFSFFAVGASALLETGDGFSVSVSGDKNKITVRSSVQLTATITVPADSTDSEEDFTVVWSTASPEFATVDSNGLVTGVAIGKAKITATVTDKSGVTVSGSCDVFVIRSTGFPFSLFEKQAILGYRYSYEDDYFYTDNDNCWQSNFGFINAFDLVCPYILIEYDYIRMHFNYGGKAWMIQLWKGQYGMVFYGSEIGVYCKDGEIPEGEPITAFTHYNCATNDKLGMEMALYWDEKNDGNYVYQLSRPYDEYWWCTGFKSGHLWQSEPADELRMVSSITLKDEAMADIFANQLELCGFKRGEAGQELELDSFVQDGDRVSLVWQNISEAESTVVVKATLGALFATGSMGLIFLVLAFIFLSFISAIFFIFIL